MNNAEKFKQIFGIYATELWAMPENEFLEWINSNFSGDVCVVNNGDTISRQAAIDALTGIEFCHCMEFGEYIGENTREVRWIRAEKAQDALQNLPSTQPEIIRCKDCKFWQDQEEGVVEVPICARPQNKFEKHPMVMIINGDGYCSFAGRRTDGQTDT